MVSTFFFLKIGKPEEEEYFMTCKYCMKFEFQCHKSFYWKITVLIRLHVVYGCFCAVRVH